MRGTTTSSRKAQSLAEGKKLLASAINLWCNISPVCTVEAAKGDEWNTYLNWRGHRMGMLTRGDNMVAFTCSTQVDMSKHYYSGVNVIEEGSDKGSKVYGSYVGLVTLLEAMVRKWPTVTPDAAGNLRLLIGKGEYGLVEITRGELKYYKVESYDDKAKRGKWRLCDLNVMVAYTDSITGQIDEKDEQKLKKELDSLMEL